MKYDVMFVRGDQAYIALYHKKYYLVNIFTGKALLANPPDTPDMFLKFGYFDEVEVVDIEVMFKIEAILAKINDE